MMKDEHFNWNIKRKIQTEKNTPPSDPESFGQPESTT